mgnify:CR=1 FL=1
MGLGRSKDEFREGDANTNTHPPQRVSPLLFRNYNSRVSAAKKDTKQSEMYSSQPWSRSCTTHGHNKYWNIPSYLREHLIGNYLNF